MKKYLLAILVSAIFCSTAKAQGTGFQGKKFWIEYNFHFFPDVLHNQSYTYANVNMHHELSLNYAVNMNRSIALAYKFGYTSYNFNYIYNPNYTYYNHEPESYYPTGKIFMHTVSFNTKFFRSGYIAPNGKYVKLGLDAIIYNTVYDDTIPKANAYLFNDYKGVAVFVKFGYGRQFVAAKRLVIDYGFDLGVPTNSFVQLFSDDHNDQDIAVRMVLNQFMQLHVGLGFLAF